MAYNKVGPLGSFDKRCVVDYDEVYGLLNEPNSKIAVTFGNLFSSEYCSVLLTLSILYPPGNLCPTNAKKKERPVKINAKQRFTRGIRRTVARMNIMRSCSVSVISKTKRPFSAREGEFCVSSAPLLT